MRYIDRSFLFLVIAITARAQQPAPPPADAEAALRARAEQFFQLQVDKKYRPAEAMVAEDTKDLYYDGRKFNINSFSIEKVEMLDDNTRAKVTIKASVTRSLPGAGIVELNAVSTNLWKIENGQWVYYIDQAAGPETPFGPVKEPKGDGPPPPISLAGKLADLSSLRNLVKIDRDAVEVAADGPLQTVTVSNDLPGGVDLELRTGEIAGLSAELEKKHLESGEKTLIRFRATGKGAGAGVVRITVNPIGTQLDIHVKVN
jgi:hypothetical protein